MAWEVQVTSPTTTADSPYRLTGTAFHECGTPIGASLRVRSLATGWTEEVFLDSQGAFEHELELAPDDGSAREYELTVCDQQGREAACVTIRIPHSAGNALSVDHGSVDGRMQAAYAPSLDPPWPACLQRIRKCLHLAAAVAQATGRNREELLQYVHAQERYAEQAHKENNRILYRECLENLEKYAAYLEQMQEASRPRPLQVAPPVIEEDARIAVDRLRSELAAVWKETRSLRRDDLEARLKQVAAQAQGLGQRCKADAVAACAEAKRLLSELESINQVLSATGGSGPRHESAHGSTPAPEFPGTDGGQTPVDNDPR
jgi:hypothetical protein